MMKTRPRLRSTITLVLTFLFFITTGSQETHATTDDAWWDNDWPYRISIEVSQDGPIAANLNFSQLFDNLGLNQALLDLRSIRVIPYKDGKPGSPVPFQETYSTLIIDADSFGDDASGHWVAAESISEIRVDSKRFTQGIGSIYLHARILDSSISENGFSFQFNDSGLGDWSDYETLLYDVWSEVNNEAIDQTPDLYSFELYGLTNCPIYEIKGPGMAINRWNGVSVSLKPFGNCLSPDLSGIEAMKFQLKVNMPWDDGGNFDKGDEVDFWLDNFRLVDQDGDGRIIWQAVHEFEKYYIYFDTLNHEGHPEPALDNFDDPILLNSLGEPEAGGYFNQITSVNDSQLEIWSAPITEKILPGYKVPISTQPLLVQAARGEMEAFQIIFNALTNLTRAVTVSDLVNSVEDATIPSSQFDLFRVDYINLITLSDQYGRLGRWPDPLVPLLNGQNVNFIEGQNHPLWFRIKVPIGAAPGFYHGFISIGETAIPITLQVWNFNLPDIPSLESQLGFDWNLVMEAYQAAACENEFEQTIYQTFKSYRLSPSTPEVPPTGDVYTLSTYEIQKAQSDQTNKNTLVWWQFNPDDNPPFANPGVIDRPGVDARILPWLAWLDRINGLYYPNTSIWVNNPWEYPLGDDDSYSNGNGFLFYPPTDDLLTFSSCSPERNRLIPSIRLELLREGLEDYSYLWLLNKADPIIGIENQSDSLARGIIQSDTLFSHNPTSFYAIRDEIALLLESEAIDSNAYLFLPFVCH